MFKSLCFLLFFYLQGLSCSLYADYERPIEISTSLWEAVKPYFLPENHAAKRVLDKLFQGHPTLNYSTMQKAGFTFSLPRDPRKIICAKHPKLKKYLIKTYIDEQLNENEWEGWIQRIKGAQQIQKSIDKHHFNKIMKTPKKWIYPLPINSDLPANRPYKKKFFLLLVEDMQILSSELNAQSYVLDITKTKLDALYAMLTENLLIDSIYIDNIPFCKDGKIAFIDTEHYNITHSRLKLERLTKRFTTPMANHWMALISHFKQVHPE